MKNIQVKSTGNRWADAAIAAAVIVMLYLILAVII